MALLCMRQGHLLWLAAMEGKKVSILALDVGQKLTLRRQQPTIISTV